MFIVLTMGQEDKSSRFVGPFLSHLEARDYAEELGCLQGISAKAVALDMPDGCEPGL